MKILLDCDGVIADFVKATLDYLDMFKGLRFSPEQITDHDICKALNMTESLAEDVKRAWRSVSFCSQIPPYAGAAAFVDGLRALGEVVVVTAPMKGAPVWASERQDWLEQHFGLTSIVSTREKHHVAGDVMIEDSASNLLTSIAAEKVLFSRPWNASEARGVTHQAHLVRDYFEALEVVTSIRNRRTR